MRRLSPSDAEMCAAWIGRSFPLPPPLAAAIPGLLDSLIANETLGGIVIDRFTGTSSRADVAGFGISGFLGEACAMAYLAAPFPHFEVCLLERARQGMAPTFLSYREIAQANAGDGLTLFPLVWLQRPDDPGDSEARAILALSQRSFLRMHRGYRLVRILKEADARRAQAFVNGGFRERRRLPAGMALPFANGRLAREHVVFEITKEEIEATMPGSAVGPLFQYRPPRCGFTRAEKQVLERAAAGLTDAQIARQLGITTAAVSLRWRSIYERVADRVPSALQEAVPGSGGRGRGPEKRRRVLAFLDDYPEEMRP